MTHHTAQSFITRVGVMTRTRTLSQTVVMQMRDEGRSKEDIGVFEVDLADNKITWMNDYATERVGYTLDQIKHMTLFDMIPESFHAKLQDVVSEYSEKKLSETNTEAKTSIWPLKTSNGKITWWVVTKTIAEYPIIWIYGDHIQTTGLTGMSFLFMQAFMRAANGQSGLYEKLSELKAWTTTQVSRLDEEDRRLKDSLSVLESKMTEVLAASKEAATATNTTQKMMESLQRAFQEFESKYSAEVLKLIGTDTIHDKRIDTFEKHVKLTTDLAMKSIEMQAERSTENMTNQVKETSKGLSRKVTVPVSIIATIAIIIEVLVEHFAK